MPLEYLLLKYSQSASVAEWLQYLLGQWKDQASNPSLALCLE